MAEIKCPMCGKPNPAHLNVCQYCEARLKPLTDELSRSQPPIHPGEEPTDRDTGQLESVLPQWLRDIRQQARDATGEQTGQPAEKDEARQGRDDADLLAGLPSEARREEEDPDWLVGLRNEGSQLDFEETPPDEDDLAALKSMLGEDAPAPREEDESSALPDWLAGLDADQPEQAEQPGGSASAPGADFGWQADFESETAPQEASTEDDAPFDTELPTWLQDTAQTSPEETEGGLPGWLDAEKTDAPPEGETTSTSGDDMQDWLASLEAETSGPAAPQEPAQPTAGGEVPDWLAALGEESPGEESVPKSEEPAGGELPAWLAALGEESGETTTEEQAEPSAEIQAPDWLMSPGEDGVTEEEPPAEDEAVEPVQAAAEPEIPGWLSGLGETTEETEPPTGEPETPAFASGLGADEAAAPPAFVDDEGQPISKEDVDAIFSMDMPDWLSEAEGTGESDVALEETEAQGDELRPAELPSWVQAMRPVESVISETEAAPAGEQPVEERGPLAGLRGVLPAVPGITPTGKPRAHSIKMVASDDQQSNAALLEAMLAEEAEPKPVVDQKAVLSQRILRWLIAVVLILVVGAAVAYSPQMSPVPASVPPETSAALNFINNTLPADAPVLLVFDYEAARAGEMEAAAAPFVDRMLTLKSPSLTLVSSTPVGSGLAERFMGILQADRQFARNESFLNLGYLPGGAAGVQAFSTDPVSTIGLTTTGEAAWNTPVLQGVDQLSDFAAILLLTDDIETARIWIEQTEGDRGEARLLVVSSAQSGPMIRPYARSGQVDGMVTGLEGGAPVEGINSGRPGMARRYWDAFGFGLLAAVLMIALGSLWSMIASIQALRKEQQGQG